MRRSLFSCILLALAATSAGAQQWATLDDFLARGVGLTAPQRAALARGEVVGKLLTTADVRNVAVFGAVQVDVPRAFFVERQLDVLRGSDSLVHIFSDPPAAANVAAIAVTDEDVKELRACKPNDCNFKLPASDMQAFRPADASGGGPEARARVTAIVRRRMLEYVAEYRRNGNAAMLVVEDRGRVPSSDALDAMLRDSSYAFRAIPSLGRWVTGYPRDTISGGTEAIFWSVDELPRVRPVLRIVHALLYSPTDVPGVGMSILTAKQIYANHYFEAGLETLAAVEHAGATGATDRITLVGIRRLRFDNLPSGGVLNLRGRVRNGLQEGLVADLAKRKREYESAWRARRD